jgi:hypothetical protein
MAATTPIGPRSPQEFASYVVETARAITGVAVVSGRLVLRLCYGVEQALSHGIRESVASFFLGRTRLFDLLAALPAVSDGVCAVACVADARFVGRSALGRARILLRMLLNAGTLAAWLRVLASAPAAHLLDRHYDAWAMVRVPGALVAIADAVEAATAHLRDLRASSDGTAKTPLVSMGDASINEEDYWDHHDDVVSMEIAPARLQQQDAAATIRPSAVPSKSSHVRDAQTLIAARVAQQRWTLWLPHAVADAQVLLAAAMVPQVRALRRHSVLCSSLLRAKSIGPAPRVLAVVSSFVASARSAFALSSSFSGLRLASRAAQSLVSWQLVRPRAVAYYIAVQVSQGLFRSGQSAIPIPVALDTA